MPMLWLTKLAATMVRRYRGRHLHDLEKRVAKLERRLAGSSSPTRRKPILEIGNNQTQVKELLARGNSQSEVARHLGVSRQYINKLVRRGL